MVDDWSVRGVVAGGPGFTVGPVDLELPRGSAVAVIGRSGSGKTTLLRGLAGLAPVVRGTLARRGVDLTHVPPERRGIGYVPQGLGLLPHRSVARNVGFPLELRGRSDPGLVTALLRRFALVGLADRRPLTLSAGEQQRVAMARALAADPSLLAWDEPLTGLDVAAREDLLEILADVERTEAVPILLVTHDPTAAFSLADRFLVLDAGRVVAAGTPETIAAHPADAFVARFAGFENVWEVKELGGPGPLPSALRAAAGPGGIAVRASSVAVVASGTPGAYPGLLRRLSPGPGGLLAIVESDGLWLRALSPPGASGMRPGERVSIALAEGSGTPIRGSAGG